MNFFTDGLLKGAGRAEAYSILLNAVSTGGLSGDKTVRVENLLNYPELLELATINRIAPQAAHRLIEVYGERLPNLGGWRAAHDKSARRMTLLLDTVEKVAGRLDTEEIRLVGLKNAGLAREGSDCPACSPAGDLDLLVRRDRFAEAVRLIEELGFQRDSRYFKHSETENATALGMMEFFTELDGERIWLELQHRPVGGRWIRPDSEPTGEEIVERSLPIKGSKLRLPEPSDNLLLVCLNAAKHSYVRAPGIKLHIYANRLIAQHEPDWELFQKHAERLEVRHAVYFAMLLTNGLFDTPVPAAVLARLKPADWKVTIIREWLKKAGLFEPDERKFSRPGMLAFGGLLYDDAAGFAAALLGGEKKDLRQRSARQMLTLAGQRLYDLATRYEKGN